MKGSFDIETNITYKISSKPEKLGFNRSRRLASSVFA
jgi:hypothetical protein